MSSKKNKKNVTKETKQIQQTEKQATNAVMVCTPKCPYFNDNSSKINWVYDPTGSYKVSDGSHCFKCMYDGHKITSWYAKCPKEEDLANAERTEN